MLCFLPYSDRVFEYLIPSMVVLDLIEIILNILSMLKGLIFKEIFQYFRSPNTFPFERLLPNILIFFVFLDMIKLQ